MISKLISILLLNLLFVNCIIVMETSNKTIDFNTYANSSEIIIDKSQQHFTLANPKSRGVRGVLYNNQPFEEHEYHEHESVMEPKYIIKVVAPPKRNRDAGIKELLLVLAPLAAIPLIGSAALTTFTAMFATSGYGRRKRDLLTRELLTRSFTEVLPKVDNGFVNQPIIGSQHNVGLESLLAATYSTGPVSGVDINTNAKRHPFPENDLIYKKIDKSIVSSQTTPESPMIALKLRKDQNNWMPIDTKRDEWTGGTKSNRIITNTSASFVNNSYKNVGSVVNGSEKLFTQSMLSYDQSLGKRVEQTAQASALPEQQTTNVEPIHRQLHKSLIQPSAYQRRTDFRPDFIVKNNNKINESVAKSVDTIENSGQNKYYRNFRNIKDLNINYPADMKTEESETIIKTTDSLNSDKIDTKTDNNRPETDQRHDFSTWIPFLSNPYLADIARDDGKREIQELDVIQKYLNAMGRPDYNDEIIATYLSCNGMLSVSNQCLERLTCQFSDTTSTMKQLEKDVSSLVIYSLLKNEHINDEFKSRLQRAAFFGKDNPGKCNFYNCPKNNVNKNKRTKR